MVFCALPFWRTHRLPDDGLAFQLTYAVRTSLHERRRPFISHVASNVFDLYGTRLTVVVCDAAGRRRFVRDLANDNFRVRTHFIANNIRMMLSMFALAALWHTINATTTTTTQKPSHLRQ